MVRKRAALGPMTGDELSVGDAADEESQQVEKRCSFKDVPRR